MEKEDLLELQAEIEQRKTQKAQLEGEKTSILKRVKEEWGCKSIKQAERLVGEKQEEIETLTAEIDADMEELEKMLEKIQE